jgi:hypothetical protein
MDMREVLQNDLGDTKFEFSLKFILNEALDELVRAEEALRVASQLLIGLCTRRTNADV